MAEATTPTIPERLRSARKNSDLTQQDVADRLGIRRENISSWETGDRTPNAANLLQLARVLGVSVDWLLDGGSYVEAGRDGTGDSA